MNKLPWHNPEIEESVTCECPNCHGSAQFSRHVYFCLSLVAIRCFTCNTIYGVAIDTGEIVTSKELVHYTY